MSSRPRPPPPSPDAGNDLDSTAELPVLDVATPVASTPSTAVQVAAAAPEEQPAIADTWAVSPPARAAPSAVAASAEEHRHQQLELQSRTKALQEAEERLASHAKRLLQLEQARDEALASQAAVAQRAASAEQRASAAEQRAGAAEKRTVSAEQRLAELEPRAAGLSAELAQRHAAAAQNDARLEESTRALVLAEQRAAATGEELAQTRALVSASGARTQELRQQLALRESDARTHRTRELEQQQMLAAAGRAHAAALMEDLHNQRARAMSYLESLQTLDRRREITQHLVTELHHEAEARAAELARLRYERAHRQDEALAQRAARIATLEQQVGTLTNMLTQREAQLQDHQQETHGLRTSVARLQTEINTSGERVRALEAQSAQRESSDTQQQDELRRLRSEIAGLNAALEAARRATLAATAQASSQQAALTQHTERAAEIAATLDAERKHVAQLEIELTTVRGEMDEWGSVLRSAQQERSGHLASIAAAESRARELERTAAAREERASRLEAECATYGARLHELENQLRAAGEVVQRLEADTSTRRPRITELERSGEMRQATTDTNAALPEPARHAEPDASGAEPIADGATRLLIHGEDGREVVHVLGRKTSIGRTPDNDLQLDAKFISRHHAVILAGPASTVIEDLNSTNGVQVNGRRVTRQTLRDGDQIAIGRMHYRFVMRKAAEKR
jgi:predicted nuclease with TOPRIM domain